MKKQIMKVIKSVIFKISASVLFSACITFFIVSYYQLYLTDKSLLNQIRSIVETCYFLGGVIIAICAIFALQQIKVAKDDIKIRSEREAACEAAHRCEYFKDCIMPIVVSIEEKHKEHKIPIYNGGFDNKAVSDYLQKWGSKLDDFKLASEHFNLANCLEAFSLFFVQGIASERVAFYPISDSYIEAVERILPAIFYARIDDDKCYRNTLLLYKSWTDRIKRHKLTKEVDRNISQIKSLKVKEFKTIGGM